MIATVTVTVTAVVGGMIGTTEVVDAPTTVTTGTDEAVEIVMHATGAAAVATAGTGEIGAGAETVTGETGVTGRAGAGAGTEAGGIDRRAGAGPHAKDRSLGKGGGTKSKGAMCVWGGGGGKG